MRGQRPVQQDCFQQPARAQHPTPIGQGSLAPPPSLLLRCGWDLLVKKCGRTSRKSLNLLLLLGLLGLGLEVYLVCRDGIQECRPVSCRHHLLQLGLFDGDGACFRQLQRHRAAGDVTCCSLPMDVVRADRERIRLDRALADVARRAAWEHGPLVRSRLKLCSLRPCSVPRKPASGQDLCLAQAQGTCRTRTKPKCLIPQNDGSSPLPAREQPPGGVGVASR